MAKRVIQVPIDERLLSDLDSLSRKQGQPRSVVIRKACRRYLRLLENERLDEIYREGYRRQPEEPTLGQAQAALTNQVLSEEPW